MSPFAKKLTLALSVLAFGVALTGCSKKPLRPDPSDTAFMGGSGVNDSSMLNPTGIDDMGLVEAGSTLEMRGDGVYEDDQVIRGLLEPIYFDFDKSGIKASERIKLDAAIMYLDANPQHGLLLEGHADWRGTADYNLGLGDRRAGSAREYLETAGVDFSRLETSSKGDLEAVENADETQMALDRRVELVILKN